MEVLIFMFVSQNFQPKHPMHIDYKPRSNIRYLQYIYYLKLDILYSYGFRPIESIYFNVHYTLVEIFLMNLKFLQENTDYYFIWNIPLFCIEIMRRKI